MALKKCLRMYTMHCGGGSAAAGPRRTRHRRRCCKLEPHAIRTSGPSNIEQSSGEKADGTQEKYLRSLHSLDSMALRSRLDDSPRGAIGFAAKSVGASLSSPTQNGASLWRAAGHGASPAARERQKEAKAWKRVIYGSIRTAEPVAAQRVKPAAPGGADVTAAASPGVGTVLGDITGRLALVPWQSPYFAAVGRCRGNPAAPVAVVDTSSAASATGGYSNSKKADRGGDNNSSRSVSEDESRTDCLEAVWCYMLLCVAVCVWVLLDWKRPSFKLILLPYIPLSFTRWQLPITSVSLAHVRTWWPSSSSLMKACLVNRRTVATHAAQETPHNDRNPGVLALRSCASGPGTKAFAGREVAGAHVPVEEARPPMDEGAEKTPLALTGGAPAICELRELHSRRVKCFSSSRHSLRWGSARTNIFVPSTHASSPRGESPAAHAPSLSKTAHDGRHQRSTGASARGQPLNGFLSEPPPDPILCPRRGLLSTSIPYGDVDGGLTASDDPRSPEESSSASEGGNANSAEDAHSLRERFRTRKGRYLPSQSRSDRLLTARERESGGCAVRYGSAKPYIARSAALMRNTAIVKAALHVDEIWVRAESWSLSPQTVILLAKAIPLECSPCVSASSFPLARCPPPWIFLAGVVSPVAHGSAGSLSAAGSGAARSAVAVSDTTATEGHGADAVGSRLLGLRARQTHPFSAGTGIAALARTPDLFLWRFSHHLVFYFCELPGRWHKKGAPLPSPPPLVAIPAVTKCQWSWSQPLWHSGPPEAGSAIDPPCPSARSSTVVVAGAQEAFEKDVVPEQPVEGLVSVDASWCQASHLRLSGLCYLRNFFIWCSWPLATRSRTMALSFFAELIVAVHRRRPQNASSVSSSSSSLINRTRLSRSTFLSVSRSLSVAASLRSNLFSVSLMRCRNSTSRALGSILWQHWYVIVLPITRPFTAANASDLAIEQPCLAFGAVGNIAAASTAPLGQPGSSADTHTLRRKSSASSIKVTRGAFLLENTSGGGVGHASTSSATAVGILRRVTASRLASLQAAPLSSAGITFPQGFSMPVRVLRIRAAHQLRAVAYIPRGAEAADVVLQTSHPRPRQRAVLPHYSTFSSFMAGQYDKEDAVRGECSPSERPITRVCLFPKRSANFGKTRREIDKDNDTGCLTASSSRLELTNVSPAPSSAATTQPSYSARSVLTGVLRVLNGAAAVLAESRAIHAVIFAAGAAVLLLLCWRRQRHQINRHAAQSGGSPLELHQTYHAVDNSRRSCDFASAQIALYSCPSPPFSVANTFPKGSASHRLLQRQLTLSLKLLLIAFLLCCYCPLGIISSEAPSYSSSPPNPVYKSSVGVLDVHSQSVINYKSPFLASARAFMSTGMMSPADTSDASGSPLFPFYKGAVGLRKAASAAFAETQQQPLFVSPVPPTRLLQKSPAASCGAHPSSSRVEKISAPLQQQRQQPVRSSLISFQMFPLPQSTRTAAATVSAPGGYPRQKQRPGNDPTPAGVSKFPWPGAASGRQLVAKEEKDSAAVADVTQSSQGILRTGGGHRSEDEEEALATLENVSRGGARVARGRSAGENGRTTAEGALPAIQDDYSEGVGGAADSRRAAGAAQTLNSLDVLTRMRAPGENLLDRRMLHGLSTMVQRRLLKTLEEIPKPDSGDTDNVLTSGEAAAKVSQQRPTSTVSENNMEGGTARPSLTTSTVSATSRAADALTEEDHRNTQTIMSSSAAIGRSGDSVETPQQGDKQGSTSTLPKARFQLPIALDKPEAVSPTSPVPPPLPPLPAGDTLLPTNAAVLAATSQETFAAAAAIPTSPEAAPATAQKATSSTSPSTTVLLSGTKAAASPKTPEDATAAPPPFLHPLGVDSSLVRESVKAGLTREKKQPDPVEALKEELQALAKSPHAAVVVPAVLQQEVDTDQQLVRLTIPLLPSMKLQTQSHGQNGSEAADGSDGSISTFKKRGISSSIESLGRSEDREKAGRQESEAGSTRPENDGKEASRPHGSSNGAAGETLEEMSSNEKEMVISTGLLTLFVVLAVSLVLAHVSRKCRLDWLQMPVCATLLGLVVGAALKFWLKVKGPLLDTILALNEDVFFVMLLPPIIFEGGLGLSEGSFSVPFMRNFGAIMWLACFCTIVSFCWVGCVMFFAGQLRLSLALTVRQAFAFGALISSTDPVSVLALFKDLHAKRLIHVLVFGESLLNDAISIVLYRTVASEENTNVGAAILAFFLTFFVSLLVGLAVGLFCALNLPELVCEPTAGGVRADVQVYGLAQRGKSNSGICSASSHPLDRLPRRRPETVVFVFLGLAVFSFNQEAYTFPFGLYAVGFVATFTARGISIYITCLIINFFRTSSKITGKHQLALALCGLRGAIAFALSERASHDFGGKEGAALLSLTLYLALFTILVLGPSLVVLLDFLGIFESRGCMSRTAGAADSRWKQYLKNKSGILRMRHLHQQSNAAEAIAADEIGLSSSDNSNVARQESVNGSNNVSCPRRLEQEEDEDEESLEALTQGTCGSLKRMLLHIDERYMVPLFTHSDNRHGLQRPVPLQLSQPQSEEGGILLCETVVGRRRTWGKRRKSRFLPRAVGQLAHLRKHTQDSESSLPIVGYSEFRLRNPRPPAGAVDYRRRTVSQQSGSSGRCSNRSAASAPPGRLSQHSFDSADSSKECRRSLIVSGCSSNSTDIKKGSTGLLRPRSTSGSSSNVREQSCRGSADMPSRDSCKKTALCRNGFPSARFITAPTEADLHANKMWPPQHLAQVADSERRQQIGSSCDTFVAEQGKGIRSRLSTWISRHLEHVSRGIFSVTAMEPSVGHSAEGGPISADSPVADTRWKGGGHPACTAAISSVAETQFRRGDAGTRSSCRGSRFLGSGVNTTASSGGSEARDFMEKGEKTRRRTYNHFAASFKRQQQAQYQPLQEQPEQQLDSSNIRPSVDPVIVGRPRYGSVFNGTRPSNEAGAAAAFRSEGCALGAATLAGDRVSPAAAAPEGSVPEASSNPPLPLFVLDALNSKFSTDEDYRDETSEEDVGERTTERDTATSVAQLSACPAAALQTLHAQQAIVSRPSKYLVVRSTEGQQITGRATGATAPSLPVRPPAPPDLQQQVVPQQSKELQSEKAEADVETQQEAKQAERCSQGTEWPHVRQQEQEVGEQPQRLRALGPYGEDRHSSLPEFTSEMLDALTPLQQQERAAAANVTTQKAALGAFQKHSSNV